jgi:CIC family chloride channel protein
VTTGQWVYPIVREDRTIRGVIDVHDVRLFLTERAVPAGLLVAEDLCNSDYRVVTLEEDLASALRKFYTTAMDEMPVVESEQSPKVVGLLSRREVTAAYHDQMYRLEAAPPTAPAAATPPTATQAAGAGGGRTG